MSADIRGRVCSLQSGPEVEWRVGRRSHRLGYEEFRAAVLKAGRFSAFEADATAYASGLYTRLCADPAVETWDMGYPWTGVRAKAESSRKESGA